MPQYYICGPFVSERSRVKVNATDNTYGYINKKGEMVLNNVYIRASDFSKDGYAIVATKGKKYTVINKNGEVVMGMFDDLDGYGTFCEIKDCYETVINSKYCYEHKMND